jgi:hypothetical protein
MPPLTARQRASQGAKLVSVVSAGRVTEVRRLLRAHPTLATFTARGWPLLCIAASQGHAAVVACLVEHDDVDMGATTSDDSTPLRLASQVGHFDVVKCLVDGGADVNAARSSDGLTPLYMASQKGHLDIVECLVDDGADVNAAMSNGATSLIVASTQGHKPVVKYLINCAGADLSDRAMTGVNAHLGTLSMTSDAVTRDESIRKFLRRRVAAVCGACGKNGASDVCPLCQAVYYCDRDCQRVEWARHKGAVCAALKVAKDARRAQEQKQKEEENAEEKEKKQQQPPEHACAACGKSGAPSKCKCGVVHYCNAACQRADWKPRHKAVCGVANKT